MIKYSETRIGDILKVEVNGAPGFYEDGELVRVRKVTNWSVTVENKNGDVANFINDCGAERLQRTEWKNEFPI